MALHTRKKIDTISIITIDKRKNSLLFLLNINDKHNFNTRITYMADESFAKSYDASQVEHTIYQTWEASGFFNPELASGDAVLATIKLALLRSALSGKSRHTATSRCCLSCGGCAKMV